MQCPVGNRGGRIVSGVTCAATCNGHLFAVNYDLFAVNYGGGAE